MTMKPQVIGSGELVSQVPVQSKDYIYLRTAYGTTTRISKKSAKQYYRLLENMKVQVDSGLTGTWSYKQLIMKYPEIALLIPVWAKQSPHLVSDEVLDYSEDCQQDIEDAVIAVMSKRTKLVGRAKSKPLDLSDVE